VPSLYLENRHQLYLKNSFPDGLLLKQLPLGCIFKSASLMGCILKTISLMGCILKKKIL
jgi:hypothetical protein